MTLYTLHDLTLELTQDGQEPGADLVRLLHDLSCVQTADLGRQASVRLTVRRHNSGPHVPQAARKVFRAEEFRGLECGDDFYLTDGASLFHCKALQWQGDVWLAPAFPEKPVTRQRTFWAFCLLKLLRPCGLYSLHAAGLVARNGRSLLCIGGSGSGKSTLTLGLIRQGWGYLSDDAVLLRLQPAGVEALALRQHVYINADATPAYTDLPFGEVVPDTAGAWKRRVCMEDAYPGQSVSRCFPQVLLFSRIVPQPSSTLRPMDGPSALRHLLAQSGPQLFDRRTMAQHLAVLTRLVQQATAYELQAGRDLYHEPLTLVHLLTAAEGEAPWRG